MATKERNHQPGFVVIPLDRDGNAVDDGFDFRFYNTRENAEAGAEDEARSAFEIGDMPDPHLDYEMFVVYQPVTVYRRKQGYESSKVDG